ncbi:hypothetical protein Trydic_g2130 [Trypoxylus dichotomus]
MSKFVLAALIVVMCIAHTLTTPASKAIEDDIAKHMRAICINIGFGPKNKRCTAYCAAVVDATGSCQSGVCKCRE